MSISPPKTAPWASSAQAPNVKITEKNSIRHLNNELFESVGLRSRSAGIKDSAPPGAKLFRSVAQAVGHDAMVYKKTYDRLSALSNQPTPQDDFRHQLNYSDASLDEIASILRHITVVPQILDQSRAKSATIPAFSKISLMQLKDGSNLRLHEFSAVRGALMNEEDPHTHRWQLKAEHLKGAYVQKVHEECESELPGAKFHQKYELGGTQKGVSERKLNNLRHVHLQQSEAHLYSEAQPPHDFPLGQIHSVGDLARHTGTTLTLARTSAPLKKTSTVYKDQAEILETTPLDRAPSEAGFMKELQKSTAMVQLIKLSRDLKLHLASKDPTALTENEQKHLATSGAPNYFETSLLPALAILQLAEQANKSSHEFSQETVNLIQNSLKKITKVPLQKILKKNDNDIREGRFSVELSSFDELTAHVDVTHKNLLREK